MKSSSSAPVLRRLAAFTTDPGGGNPAGVWIGQALPDPEDMLAIAAEVGYSETAFVAPAQGLQRTIRYYSPLAEVSFCGHATIATGVVLGSMHGEGTYDLATVGGIVPVRVASVNGLMEAALTSIEPGQKPVPTSLLNDILDQLHWSPEELDPAIPPALAFAGAWHFVIAVREPSTLARLSYDFERVKQIMLDADLTTLQLIHRETESLIHARNPFPVGGVVEDPATGAAAAALGGFLRDSRVITAPAQFTIRQGETMGRPSTIHVKVPSHGGIVVSGNAIDIDAP